MFRKVLRAVSRKWDSAETKASTLATVFFLSLGLEGFAESAKDPFAMDTRAQSMGGANRATNLVVGLVVAGLMAAFLLPIAISEITNTSTSSWSDGAASLWSVLPIMIVLAVFLFFVGLALNSS